MALSWIHEWRQYAKDVEEKNIFGTVQGMSANERKTDEKTNRQSRPNPVAQGWKWSHQWAILHTQRKRGKGKRSNASQMTLHPQEIMLCYVLLPPCSLLHTSPLLSWNSPEHDVYTERLGNRCAARVQRRQRIQRLYKPVHVITRNWTLCSFT